MKAERCRVCGKKVKVQIQKNTGYCSAQHQEQGQRIGGGRSIPPQHREEYQDALEQAVDTVRDAEEV